MIGFEPCEIVDFTSVGDPEGFGGVVCVRSEGGSVVGIEREGPGSDSRLATSTMEKTLLALDDMVREEVCLG
jgi:hypothetical protein